VRFRLQTRIVAYFTVLLLLVIGSFAVFFNIVVSIRFEAMTNQNTVQLAIKVSQHVDSYLQQIDQVSKYFATNQAVLKILSLIAQNGVPKTSYRQLIYSRTLDDTFANALTVTSTPTCSVYLYNDSGTYSDVFNDRKSSFRTVMRDAASRTAIENRQRVLYAAKNENSNAGNKRLISLVRGVFGLNGTQFGYIEVQDDYTELTKICDIGPTGQVIILDSLGKEVYPLSGRTEPNQADLKLGNAQNPAGSLTFTGGDLYAYAWSDFTGYTVFVKEHADAVLAPLIYLRGATYGTILVITLFALAMVYVISTILMVPIRKLRDSVVQVNLENMKLNVDEHSYSDEIQLLNSAFQDMLHRLKRSIEKTTILNREEMNARFAALQARIAPHFIHNVLYVISILAREKRTDDVEATCKRLSDMLRYVVHSPEETVTVGDEVAYALDYLSLQKQIYDDALNYNMYVDAESRRVLLPRLVIQPFVENSIHNGFKNKLPPWNIEVRCEVEAGRWNLSITDNGCGVDEETVRRLLEKAASEQREFSSVAASGETEITGMAILNTCSRLRLLYGALLGFEISTNAVGGTTVLISGPVQPERL